MKGLADGLTAEPVITWDDPGTDRMRLVRRRVPMRLSNNLPANEGRAASITDFVPEVIAGFRAMCDLLVRHRAEVLADDGPISWFAGATVRTLLRSTQIYSDVLDQSYHPDLLRDGLDREHFVLQSMDAGGGLAAVSHQYGDHWVLPLPVAGLMATGTCEEVGRAYQELDAAVKRWGSPLRAPFMTL